MAVLAIGGVAMAAAPTNVHVTSQTQTSITIAWSGSAPRYAVWRDGSFVQRTTLRAFTYTGLGCGTTHRLGVRSVASDNTVSGIVWITASTLACSAPPPTGGCFYATGSSATSTESVGLVSGDATGVIQAAIDRATASGGGVVQLAAGTYTVNGKLVVKSNVRLSGAGADTRIKAGSAFLGNQRNGGYPLLTTSGQNVTVSGLTADQSGDTLNGNVGGRLSAYLVDIRDSSNVVVDNVHTRNPFTYSIVAVSSDHFCIRNSSTRVATSGRYDQLDGIHVLSSSYGDVVDNDVDQRVGTDGDDGLVAHTIWAPTHDIRYVGNRVRGGNNGNGMQLAVGNYAVYNLVIADNEFYDSPFGIRTGYYDNGTGAVHNVSLDRNNIHDLRGGHAFPTGGDAIAVGYFGANGPVTYVTATANRACNAGVVKVVAGEGNSVTGTTGC